MKINLKSPLKKVHLGLILMTSLFMPKLLFSAEKNLYDFQWLDPDKAVYVLQNKLYKKIHSGYANLGLLKGVNTRFQSTYGFNIKGGYYFLEEWGVEAYISRLSNSNNTTYKNVLAVNSLVPFVRRPIMVYGLMGIWSPFYGKINTFNKIFYFDWMFGLGIGNIKTETNRASVLNSTGGDAYVEEDEIGLMWKTNLRFYFTEKWHLDVDFTNINYKALGVGTPAKKSININSDLGISVGYKF